MIIYQPLTPVEMSRNRDQSSKPQSWFPDITPSSQAAGSDACNQVCQESHRTTNVETESRSLKATGAVSVGRVLGKSCDHAVKTSKAR